MLCEQRVQACALLLKSLSMRYDQHFDNSTLLSQYSHFLFVHCTVYVLFKSCCILIYFLFTVLYMCCLKEKCEKKADQQAGPANVTYALFSEVA